MKEDWTSPVPPKQEEIYDDLGLIPTGDGKFYIAMSYYDNKNSTFIQRRLDGQASSRDGKILVYMLLKPSGITKPKELFSVKMKHLKNNLLPF